MGITHFSHSLIKRTKLNNLDIKSVLELGSQNDYTTNEATPPFANELYRRLGIEHYICIDLAGDNNAFRWDLSNPQELQSNADLVTDFGTGEHCVEMTDYEITPFLGGYINSIYPTGEIKSIEKGFYNLWLNKHNFLKVGGFMINENPLTGNWPNYGYSYLGKNFYDELCKISDYQIIEQGEEAATGNDIDGWNKWAILKKAGEKFPSFEEFTKLPIFRE